MRRAWRWVLFGLSLVASGCPPVQEPSPDGGSGTPKGTVTISLEEVK